VVDDVALNREILTMHLEGAVQCTDEAEDGYAALALFKKQRYDAVLLDIEMPGLDGCQTLVEMRAWELQQRLPKTLVVAVTSSDFPDDEQRIMSAGATTYLVKPVKQRTLLAALQVHCREEARPHPMAKLLPKLFTIAGSLLEEIGSIDQPETVSNRLHQLRGLVAVYGFVDFAERLREVHLRVQQGEMLEVEEFERLREELQRLEADAIQP